MTERRFKRAERRVAAKLGTQRTPLSGINSRHTSSDTLHPDLYIEVKLRRRPPFFDRLAKLRKRARRIGRLPLIVADQVEGGLVLNVTGLDAFLALELEKDVRAVRPFGARFLTEHVAQRRSALFSLWHRVEPKARDEGKRPLVVYKASRRPGELVAWR